MNEPYTPFGPGQPLLPEAIREDLLTRLEEALKNPKPRSRPAPRRFEYPMCGFCPAVVAGNVIPFTAPQITTVEREAA